MPDGSYLVSYIQNYIKYIIKKNETLPTNPTIQIYIIRINNRSVFKIKDGYKLELQTPETMKLFGSTKKINRQNKDNFPTFEISDTNQTNQYLDIKNYILKTE